MQAKFKYNVCLLIPMNSSTLAKEFSTQVGDLCLMGFNLPRLTAETIKSTHSKNKLCVGFDVNWHVNLLTYAWEECCALAAYACTKANGQP